MFTEPRDEGLKASKAAKAERTCRVWQLTKHFHSPKSFPSASPSSSGESCVVPSVAVLRWGED